MLFKDYQDKAKATLKKSEISSSYDDVIHYLGLIGEVGSVISELKKKIRDGKSYTRFKPQLKEELGDLLWYISTIATINNLPLEEIAKDNLNKTNRRFGDHAPESLEYFDKDFPLEEQFPREFEISFVSKSEKSQNQVSIYLNGGGQLGHTLTDNSYTDDGYRFHDIFHYSYLAILGWSPVLRKLLNVKRKSKNLVDEVEDGARAAILEEMISLYVYNEAKSRSIFKDAKSIETTVLQNINNFCTGLEVSKCSLKIWEKAILDGYKVFHSLVENDGGRVLVSLKNRSLLYIGKN